MEHLSDSEIEFLKEVELYGTNKIRYNKVKYEDHSETSDYTDSIFIYSYKDVHVIIHKIRGKYVDYFIRP